MSVASRQLLVGDVPGGGWANGGSPFVPAPWGALADALLAREAVRRPRSDGGDPFATLRVSPQELESLLQPPRPPDGKLAASTASVVAASAAFRRSLEEPSLLSSLRRLAGLGDEELEVLAVLLAVELDPARQRAVAYLQDNVSACRPTLATLAALFPPPHSGPHAVAAGSAMVATGLVEVGDEGPWGARPVSVAAPVVWTFTGDNSLDPDLPAGVEFVEVGASPTEGGGLLLVSGADRASRLQVAADRLPVAGLLVSEPPEEETAWIALAREATLAGAAIVIESPGKLLPLGRRLIDRTAHLWWVLSSPAELPLEGLPVRPWREVRLEPSSATEEDWQRVAGRLPPPGLSVNREQLRLLALAADGLDCAPDAALARVVAPHLGSLTVRVRPERTWEDLVLPADQLAAVKELVARYRHRNVVFGDWGYRPYPSAGIIGLFIGAPGTGKTLAAEIVAGSVGCDLFKLDISSVVSKYIGETEKNLEAVFQAAETGETVLFFDEADALFGKRSEVKDSHDRYANIEVAYLLQRLERHDGLVLMATNMANNLDPAFERRINVAVTFPLPGEAERRLLWQKSFPPESPAVDIDYDWLVQWEIAGGLIRNAALTAAFLAAEADTPITMATVATALRRELQKNGRLLTGADFDSYISA